MKSYNEAHTIKTRSTNINDEGLHWTANEYAENVGSFIDPICCNFCMVLSMSLGWFWPIFLFSLRDINLTLGLLPPRKHVVLRDSVGVESSGSGLKIIVRGYFASEFSLLRHTDEPQKGRNSCLWLQTRYVLSSFGVLLMSCRVKFHVVRSALQYSACRIIRLSKLAIMVLMPEINNLCQ